MKQEIIKSNWEQYKTLLLQTKREGIEDLINWLEQTDFKTAPASTRYHLCEEGGLMQHSLHVLEAMRLQADFMSILEVTDETIVLTSLLHDICKVDTYTIEMRNKKNENGQWISVPFYQVKDTFPIGHAEKSIMIIQQFISLTEVEIAMIRNHMGFSKDEMHNVSRLFSLYPEALFLHNADMIATYIMESTDMDLGQQEKCVEHIQKES